MPIVSRTDDQARSCAVFVMMVMCLTHIYIYRYLFALRLPRATGVATHTRQVWSSTCPTPLCWALYQEKRIRTGLLDHKSTKRERMSLDKLSPGRASDLRNQPEISCSDISFSIDPLRDRSATGFTIKNPHDKPLFIQVSQSACESVMSVFVQRSCSLPVHMGQEERWASSLFHPASFLLYCSTCSREHSNTILLPAGQSATCTVAVLHSGTPTHFLLHRFSIHEQVLQRAAIPQSSAFALL